eukprot:SAG31_NODE_1789_length_7236_cov_7.210607_7_plen_167_part_00
MSITPAEANLRQQAAASVATSEAALAPSSFDGVPKMFTSPAIWWYLTAVYFGYVTLGGFSPSLHEHIYTGNASDPVLDRIIAGQFVTFSKRADQVVVVAANSSTCFFFVAALFCSLFAIGFTLCGDSMCVCGSGVQAILLSCVFAVPRSLCRACAWCRGLAGHWCL